MKRASLVAFIFVALFLIPMTGGPYLDANSKLNQKNDESTNSVWSQDSEAYSGTGDPIYYEISGTAKNGTTLTIDSTTSEYGVVGIDSGFSGSNLDAVLDSLSLNIANALANPTWDTYTQEKFLTGGVSGYDDQNVAVPNFWTMIDAESSGSDHPLDGLFRNIDYAGTGYGGSRGFSFRADWQTGWTVYSSDELYMSQMVAASYRDVTSIHVSFYYYVEAASNLNDQCYLFIRVGGDETKFRVFESGDSTGTWLQASVTISSSFINTLSFPNSLLFEIGLGTDQNGVQSAARTSRVYIDEVVMEMDVRPFPEQIDLKLNETSVVGSIPGSISQYVPYGSGRDCYDDSGGNGIDLDGYPWGSGDGDLNIGIYDGSGNWASNPFQGGVQFPVNIPRGAAITSAYFELESSGSPDGIADMRIYLADDDDTSAFTTGIPTLEDRYTWLGASIVWDITSWTTNTRYSTPDVSSLLQSVIARSGWEPGNYVTFMLDIMNGVDDISYNDFKGTTGFDSANAYRSYDMPRLVVEYLVPLETDIIQNQHYNLPYYKDITIHSSQVTAVLNDFPVMIDIFDSDLRTDAQPDGSDIMFTVDGNPVYHEIELFEYENSTHAHLVAWVNVPALSSSVDTVIRMHYCGSSVDLDSTNIWNNYEMVQHMDDNPSGTIFDSTWNNHDGFSNGSMSSNDVVAGQVGYGLNFDGDDDVLSVGQIATDDWSSFSISAWIFHNDTDDDRIFSKAPNTNPVDAIIHFAVQGTNFRIRYSTDYSTATSVDAGGVTVQNWHHLVWTWSAATAESNIYVDGSLIQTDTKNGVTPEDSTLNFTIGNWQMIDENNPVLDRFFNGTIDELRMTTMFLSTSWIETEFNNQYSPDTFYSVGSENTNTVGWSADEQVQFLISTSSTSPIDVGITLSMDFIGTGSSLDENMQEGTSFFVTNSSLVDWTANILVSPPALTDSMDFVVNYPITEWIPTSVTNPIGQAKIEGTDWDYTGGKLTIFSSAVDIWGVWEIKFQSWNYVQNVQLGINGQSLSDTAIFDINDVAQFRATTPWIENAKVGFVLSDPTDTVWYETSATSGTPGTTWHVPSFQYRKVLTILASQVDADVTNFPVMVSFSDTDLGTRAQSDGDDIVFTDSIGKVLSHEIERYDSGALVAWVKANLTSTLSNTLYMYYGNPVIGPTEQPTEVWTNNYDAVWHLSEDYTDETFGNAFYDSTIGNYTGTGNGTDRTVGMRDGHSYGQDFDGNDWISIAASEGLDLSGDLTLSGWFYIADSWGSTSSPSRLLMSKYLDGDDNFHIMLIGADYSESTNSPGSLAFGFEVGGSEYTKYTTTTSWSSGWYYYTCYMDADAPSNNKIFINGVDDTSTTVHTGASSLNLAFTTDWGIGGGYLDPSEVSAGEAYHTGKIDEVRIAGVQRVSGWISTEYKNMFAPTTFVQRGSQQTRTSPEHSVTKTIDSTAPAGIWTVSVYYNDTGASVSDKTGLYEREFLVKHDSSLTLVSPGDAVSDQVSLRFAGDLLYVEVYLDDDVNSQSITGATVSMNWTVSGSPTAKTFNDYGTGYYGIAVNTSDLGTATSWRIDIQSSHPYYNDATTHFDLQLYHHTSLTYLNVSTTPVGFDFKATLVFTNAYTGLPITGATITLSDGSPVTVEAQGGGKYNISVSTSGLNLGEHIFAFNATKSGFFLEQGYTEITFILRKHYTTASIVGNTITPYGLETNLTVVVIDTDLGIELDETYVDSFILSWFGDSQPFDGSSLNVLLDTSDWSVSTRVVTLSLLMSHVNYSNPTDYSFDVTIRTHYTAVSVSGGLTTPFGVNTPINVKIIDLDTGDDIGILNVSQLSFTSSYGTQDVTTPGNNYVTLITSSWLVGAETVTLSVSFSNPNYAIPDDYQFDVQIRVHYTALMITGDFTTAHGLDTDVRIIVLDTDTGTELATDDVTLVRFQWTGGYQDANPSATSTFDFVLDTSPWPVGLRTVTTFAVVDSSSYDSPDNFVFNVTIRGHYTSASVSGDFIQPFGSTSPLTISIIDLDTGASVALGNVGNYTFNWSGGSQFEQATSWDVTLDTSSWPVMTRIVNLTIKMSNPIFAAPDIYQFNVEIRKHYTSTNIQGDLVTPFGYDTNLTIVLTDTDTGTQLDDTFVSSYSFLSSYGSDPGSPSTLNHSLDTDSWSVSQVSVTLSLSMSGDYESPSDYDFVVTIRKHYTVVGVQADFLVPYGFTTDVTIVLTDVDTGLLLTQNEIESFTFTSWEVEGDNQPGISSLDFTLTTDDWTLGPETVVLSVIMDSDYFNPTDYSFEILVRKHHTAMSVQGDFITPYGEVTHVTIVLVDLDTGTNLDHTFVSSFTFTSSSEFEGKSSGITNLNYTLTTDDWVIGSDTVTLTLTMNNIYSSPDDYDFAVTIRKHYTSLSVDGDLLTPFGFNTPLIIVIVDLDTASELTHTSVYYFNFTSIPSPYSEVTPSDLDVNLPTNLWSIGDEIVTLSVTMVGSSEYYDPTDYDFTITIRKHHTAMTVQGDFVTAYGYTTAVTILLTDLDTVSILDYSDVGSFGFVWATGNHNETSPGIFDLDVLLATDTWSVASHPVTLGLDMTGIYESPDDYSFSIIIRTHYTAITVIGDLVSPYGNDTPLTIVITDLDTGAQLDNSSVAGFTFSSGYAPYSPSNTQLDLVLPTNIWNVGTETVTLSMTMSGIYGHPGNYVFDIVIHSLKTYLYNEPTDLIYPIDDDFQIIIRFNVSEDGNQYNGAPINGITQGEFTVTNGTGYTFPASISFLSDGRYNLSISATFFQKKGSYSITIRVIPSDSRYGSTSLIIIFEYREALSFLSSDNYPQVITPYGSDVWITLNYTDIDRNAGISGATITATGISISYYEFPGTPGLYNVTLLVGGLDRGIHYFDLTAESTIHAARTLSNFRILVRIVYTYAIPTVGALDIPVGNDPVFYVEYWDIDNNLPIDDSGLFELNTGWDTLFGRPVIMQYLLGEGRYRITLPTEVDDPLQQNVVVLFNFSKGSNYQFGLFNLTISLRTHNTDFRTVNAPEPTYFNANITIDVFYGDLDDQVGIKSKYVLHRVEDINGLPVTSYLFNGTLPGYYVIKVPANQFGPGLFGLKIFFNWTGPVYTYQNKTINTQVNIGGTESAYALLITAEPTPYLENMTYTFFYSDFFTGIGIDNTTSGNPPGGNVFISIEFQSYTVDLSKVTITEVIGQPGNYSISFNNTIFGTTGVILMNVYIGWNPGVDPYYTNRTDVIAVRVNPRDTILSVTPPTPTPYGENATFIFTYDDVTGAGSVPIAYNSTTMEIILSLADFSLFYNDTDKTFTVSFDTNQFTAPIEKKSFTLSVTWDGAPFYADRYGRQISVTLTLRQTVVEYQTPSPTPFGDNVVFSVIWTDVTGTGGPIDNNVNLTLYDVLGSIYIPFSYYSVTPLGDGEYSVDFNASYYTTPGTFGLRVYLTNYTFFMPDVTASRFLEIRYRTTFLTADPVPRNAYNTSVDIILYYQDFLTLDNIDHDVSVQILSPGTWYSSMSWLGAPYNYYLLTVQTYNHPAMVPGNVTSLIIQLSYQNAAPFYSSRTTVADIETRARYSTLDLSVSPSDTPYLEYVNFTIRYYDVDLDATISGGTVSIYKGLTTLVQDVDYLVTPGSPGYYDVSVLSTALDGLGATSLKVSASYSGIPYHAMANLTVTAQVVKRTSNVEILVAPSATNYLEDVTFIFAFTDAVTGQKVQISDSDIKIYDQGVLLTQVVDYTLNGTTGTSFEVTINSVTLSTVLINNLQITVEVIWDGSVPYYRDDSSTTKVSIIPRDTLVSVSPPINTAYGENATFTFSFLDVSGGGESAISFDPTHMDISTSLFETPEIFGVTEFTIEFDTAQFGGIGQKTFTLSVTWAGAPYYSNRTLITIRITVTLRASIVEFQSPDPTPFGDSVVFTVEYQDIAGLTTTGILDSDCDFALFYSNISGNYPLTGFYSVNYLGSGVFEIDLDSSYFATPGLFTLNASFTYTGSEYVEDAWSIRQFSVRYRSTILSNEPVGRIGIDTIMNVILDYQDILTLQTIVNGTTFYTSFEILNTTGPDYVYSITWDSDSQKYELQVETAGRGFGSGINYTLHVRMSYVNLEPFYAADELYIAFSIRGRIASIDLEESPQPTAYNDITESPLNPFVVLYLDTDASIGIDGASISLEYSNGSPIALMYYTWDALTAGEYQINLNTSALGAPAQYTIFVFANKIGAPYYYNEAVISVRITVTTRPTNVDVKDPPQQTKYLDLFNFTLAFTDVGTGNDIIIDSGDVIIYNGGTLLSPSNYIITPEINYFRIVINTTKIANATLTRILTITVTWSGGAPYYASDSTPVSVTITKRVARITIGLSPDTPMQDLMRLTFNYTDDTTGNGIVIPLTQITLACDQVTLTWGANYWVYSGALPGEYYIDVSTTFLGSFGIFTFRLNLDWIDSSRPFYRDISGVPMVGSVRGIRTSITPDSPVPSTVPLKDNVSITITLNDIDHTLPDPRHYINDVSSSITVVYSSGSEPAIWDIEFLFDGQYLITVNTLDAGAAGLKSLVITFNLYPYDEAESQVSFQVRLRQASIQEVSSTKSRFAGDEGYILVWLNDTDANVLVDGASSTVTWLSVSDVTPISGGFYNITFQTTSIPYGVKILKIVLSLSSYSISAVYFDIEIKQVETDLTLSDSSISVYWRDEVTITAVYYDTVHSRPVLAGDLTYSWILGSDIPLIATGVPGNFTFSLDTQLVPHGTYAIQIIASYENHITQTKSVTLTILQIPVSINPSGDDFTLDTTRGSEVTIRVNLEVSDSPYAGEGVIDANVLITWDFGSEQSEYFTQETGGNYSFILDTDDAEASRTYTLVIEASKNNYLISPIIMTLVVKQTMTVVQLDINSQSIADENFYWSQIVEVGVWVYAPYINETENPDEHWRNDATVTMSLIGEGTPYPLYLLNRSVFGANYWGYYNVSIDTSQYPAQTYTLRISAVPLNKEYTSNSTTTTLSIRAIHTLVEAPEIPAIFWGGNGTYGFNFVDEDHESLVINATVTYQWANRKFNATPFGNGTYGIFIDSTLVEPSTEEYSLTVDFRKDNYDYIPRTVRVRVRSIPTEIVVYPPKYSNSSMDATQLVVPFGDSITVILFYNATVAPWDTPFIGGVEGANWTLDEVDYARYYHPVYDTSPLDIIELGNGNYSFTFDTSLFRVDDARYRFTIPLRTANRTQSIITIFITIIDVPTDTAFTSNNVDSEDRININYAVPTTVELRFYDAWPGHVGDGITGAYIKVISSNPEVVNVTSWEEIGNGIYRLTIEAPVLFPIGLPDVSSVIDIRIYRVNHVDGDIELLVGITPTEFQDTLTTVTSYGTPIVFILLLLGALYVRVLSVPKRLRQINGQIKALGKGKVPKPIDEAKRRDQLIAELFNDTFEQVKITRRPDQLPSESVIVAVPEMGELLVQLSILTHLSPDELDEFKADISKMRLSEQAAFVKEVIYQEAIRAARRDGKSVEKVLEEVADQASRTVAGVEEGEVPRVDYRGPEEDSIFLVDEDRPKKPPIDFDEPIDVDEEMESTIMKAEPEAKRMADKRPEDYLPERPASPDEKLSPFELAELRKELEEKGVPPHEIDTIMEQAEHLSRELVDEFVKSLTGKK